MSEMHTSGDLEREVRELRARNDELEKRVERLEMSEEALMQTLFALFPQDGSEEPPQYEYKEREAAPYRCDPAVMWITRQAKRSLDLRAQERGRTRPGLVVRPDLDD